MALTSASGHRGPAREGWTFWRANVDSSVCVSASKTAERTRRGRGGAGGTMRNLCFSSVCLRLALEMKVSGGEGVGAGARIFGGASHRAVEGPVWPYYGRARWAGRSQSPRGAAETGMMPIRMEQANICLAQKNPD